MSVKDLFLGIDGGGSKTRGVLCQIGEEGCVHTVWQMEGPAANWLGAGDAGLRLRAALRELCGAAQRESRDAVRGVTAGLAGKELSGREEIARAVLQHHFPAAYCQIITDAEAAHWAGGLPLDGRATVVSGTGSTAIARSAGQWYTAGGQGIILADEGSGFTIGRAGLRCALQHEEDRGEAPVLHQRALRHFGLERAKDLVRTVHRPWGIDVAAVAGFAPEVFRAARRGEDAAEAIVRRAGRDLASLFRGLQRQGARLNSVQLVGSCWRGRPPLALPFSEALWSWCGDVRISSPAATPAEGAALCAAFAGREGDLGGGK